MSIGFGPRAPDGTLCARSAKLVAKSPCSALAGRSIVTSGSATDGRAPACLGARDAPPTSSARRSRISGVWTAVMRR